jgi:FKBP-type peptidyl-prolyl cis-trans isomerase
MKLKPILTISLLSLGLAAARAQEVKLNIPGQTPPSPPAASAAAPAAPAAVYPDAQLIEEFGWFVGKRVGLAEIEFNKTEIDAFLKGISTAAAGKESPYDLEKVGPAMDGFMQKKQGAYLAKLKNQNTAATAAYFAKLKENKNVIMLPSGLGYEIVKPGEGAFPKPTETVKVHYSGALLDGTVFDASLQHTPPDPVEFPLDQVIPGWTEGIQKINKGGKIKLYVPPQLGYGDEGSQRIPPGSTLVFDVELLDIKPTPPPSATPAMPAMPGAPGGN